MADSQALYPYPPATISELERNLSSERFGAYLTRSGHRPEYAIQLYLYNARIAKSLLFPLHILEVILRNGIDEALSTKFSYDWHLDQSFIDTLTHESNISLAKARHRFKYRVPSKSELIAELSLDFWSNLFRSDYDRTIWQTSIHILFPQRTFTRAAFKPEIMEINKLRNRIAHHEPILDINTSVIHTKVLNIIAARSQDSSDWVKAHSTFNQMMRTKPNPGSGPGPFLNNQVDKSFAIVSKEETILSLASRPEYFFACLDDKGAALAIFTHADISKYVLLNLESGMIDLNDHSIENLISSLGLTEDFDVLGETESIKILPQFFKKRVRYALILSEQEPQTAVGIIEKSHRRY
ncbi:Abi family protein [Pseudomonas sp. MS15a(2019)]|uniref:Abi family protein n=1 Tax=Pseudomonas sp. MS15a(2019) TaxID=2579938 RepID=UPI001563F9FF|nr:Abi family protein [Pseudomonas sp. MS15a(2019)]NRH42250.1 Abi family protein [Pseudomonas sp. MS15a(2019)]